MFHAIGTLVANVIGVFVSTLMGAVANAFLAWKLDPQLLLQVGAWKCILLLAPITALPLMAMALVIYGLVGRLAYYVVVPLLKVALSFAVGLVLGFVGTHVLLDEPMTVLGVGVVIGLLSWLMRNSHLALVAIGIMLISLLVAFSIGVLP